MLSETRSRVDQLISRAGRPVKALRFEGDISSASASAVLGSYQSLPNDSARFLLLDFAKVDYINSSGIALVIQMLIKASKSGQSVSIFGLSQQLSGLLRPLVRIHVLMDKFRLGLWPLPDAKEARSTIAA